jgi:acetoin:2,6-dichlorophenolindophenol oxidoreductase subunit alpha
MSTAAKSARIDCALAVQLYQQMRLIRSLEERVTDLSRQRQIRGSVHSYVGMEAVAVGVCSTLRGTDLITSTHRGHGHAIAKGLELRRIFGELLGRETGYCRGRGGTMHITSMAHGMLGADAIVGGTLPIAVGAAYAQRLQGRDNVVVAFFGDGAINEGTFHEAANLAAIHAVPVVFVCENNRWALSTPIEQTVGVESLAARAAAYGFPGVVVDGNDVAAVREVSQTAVDRARLGSGPTLIEAQTYRVAPHSSFSTNDRRTEEEIDAWRQHERDPIQRWAAELVKRWGVGQSELDGIASAVEESIDQSLALALSDPRPDPAQVAEDVYAPAAWLDRLGGRA